MTQPTEANATQQQDTAEAPPKPRLLDQMRQVIRVKHYSLRTEKTYVGWAARFIRWSGRTMHGVPHKVTRRASARSLLTAVLERCFN